MIERVIDEEVILVADETIVSKSGKETYGLGYFYSGIDSKAIKGISFLSFSIVDVESRRAYLLFTKQMKKAKREKIEKKSKKRGVGRPKGGSVTSRNKCNLQLSYFFKKSLFRGFEAQSFPWSII